MSKEKNLPEDEDPADPIDPAAQEGIDALLRSLRSEPRDAEADEARDALLEMQEEAMRIQMDESNPRWDHIEFGSQKSLLYEVIAEKFPQFHISITSDPLNNESGASRIYAHVNVTPYKTDRVLLQKIAGDPAIMSLLAKDGQTEKFEHGIALEKEGVFPAGTMTGVLARYYTHEIDGLGKRAIEDDIAGVEINIPRKIQGEYREKLEKLNVEPISDQALKELFEQAIDRIIGDTFA